MMQEQNKKIWELWVENTTFPRRGKYSSAYADPIPDNTKTFAEAIVKECAEFTDPDTRSLLFKHFGIEE